jgi:hypothetical protein
MKKRLKSTISILLFISLIGITALYHFPVIFQTRINTDLILIKYFLSQT